MKFLFLISLFLVSTLTYAQEVDPTKFCEYSYECTDKMREISNKFEAGNALFSQQPLIAFSGSCYHISSLYNGETEHHGAFIFERTDRGLLTTGIFSFFWGYDQFKDMTTPQVKEYFVKNNSSFDMTIESPKQVELQYLTDESDYHYWFRSDAAAKNMYLIAKQASGDYSGYIFCEMGSR